MKYMPTVQIIFVSRNKEAVIKSIREIRDIYFDKIILIIGDEKEDPNEKVIWDVAKEIKFDLNKIWDIHIRAIHKRNILKATNQLVEIISEEKMADNVVFLNTTGLPNNISIGAYIAACMFKARVFTSTPKYNSHGEEVGVEGIFEAPIIPIDYPGDEQRQIITLIGDGVDSLDTIIYKQTPYIEKNTQIFRSERSRISHHISKLEEAGFIVKEKKGRNISINLSGLGRILAEITKVEYSKN